jgi:hypothetical protein
VSLPGQAFTSSDSLDEHFALNQPEYQAMCHAVAIQPGWHAQTSPYDLGSPEILVMTVREWVISHPLLAKVFYHGYPHHQSRPGASCD